jgi:hypothetical protein
MLKVDRANRKMLENMARQRSERLAAQAASPVPLRSFTVTEAQRGQWQVGVRWWDNGASDYITCVHDVMRHYYTVSPYCEKFGGEQGCYYYWCPWFANNTLSVKLTEQFDMIEKYKSVLVTLDETNNDKTYFKRTGYRSIHAVSRLDFDEDGWGFQFDEMLGVYKK